MPRTLAFSVLVAATPKSAPAGAANRYDSGRVARVTDGDTFRLESGERIRIARIDAPETHRDQAKCAGEKVTGLRAKYRATALLAGRELTLRRVGRCYNRTVATVVSTAMISAPSRCKSASRHGGRAVGQNRLCHRAS